MPARKTFRRKISKRRTTRKTRRHHKKSRRSMRRMVRGGGFIPNGSNRVHPDDKRGIINFFRNQERYANNYDFNGKDDEESFGLIYDIVNRYGEDYNEGPGQPNQKQMQILYTSVDNANERKGTILRIKDGKLSLGLWAPRTRPQQHPRVDIYEP